MGETFKHQGLLLGGDANPGVFDLKADQFLLLCDAQLDMTLLSELDRIAQQIDQYLHQAVAICQDPDGQVGVDFLFKSQSHAFDAGDKQTRSAVSHLAQDECFWMNPQFARLKL